MLAYVKFIFYMLRHKWHVFVECCKYGLIWRGVIHDWTKFLPGEMVPYAKATFGKDKGINYGLKKGFMALDPEKDHVFHRAVFRHQHTHPHHWQHWLFIDNDGNATPIKMDRASLLEMFADWKAANKMHGDFPNTYEWYKTNKDKLKLHKVSRRQIEFLLKREYERS